MDLDGLSLEGLSTKLRVPEDKLWWKSLHGAVSADRELAISFSVNLLGEEVRKAVKDCSMSLLPDRMAWEVFP